MKKMAKSKGNMYDWVTHMHSHLEGKCEHGCSYCYVQSSEAQSGKGTYSGPIRLDPDSLKVCYGENKTIFIEHMNDICAQNVPDSFINAILNHCAFYPFNRYVFQSKNPGRLLSFLPSFPKDFLLGTTVESDQVVIGQYTCLDKMPPLPLERINALIQRPKGVKCFITVEPIIKMENPKAFAKKIAEATPDFVNIGADSKKSNLQEPTKDEIWEFVHELQALGVNIRKKVNLGRILGNTTE